MTQKRYEPADIKKAYVRDGFWDRYTGKVPERIIPYQWDMMNDRIQAEEKSGCMHNFRAAAGEEDGEFTGMVFQDSDLAKWLEAAAFSLATRPDPALERHNDRHKNRGHLPSAYCLLTVCSLSAYCA